MNVAVFSLLGVIAGAVLQYFFTRHLDDQRHRRELRTRAYTDYLKAVCEKTKLGEHYLSPEGKALTAALADAKSRICLYGSSKVIEAFAEFERLGATINTESQCAAFTKMVVAMRADSGSTALANVDDVQIVLLGDQRTKDPRRL